MSVCGPLMALLLSVFARRGPAVAVVINGCATSGRWGMLAP
ncbi:hypothetical protein [Streptomyces sp. B3I8]|nr:hypothetical protein [Streptomyces sp. B3I8]MDQ0789744.1 hypothetical protein [Streptomyces sp. B3I8]